MFENKSKRLLNLTPTGLVWNTNMTAVSLSLAHQYGGHDVIWKRFIVRQIQNEVLCFRETKQPPQTLWVGTYMKYLPPFSIGIIYEVPTPLFTKTAGHKTFLGRSYIVTTL